MARVFYLSDVLQFVINGFYNGPLPCQQFVRHRHQSSLHVALEFCNQLDAVNEQALEKFLAYISLVSNKFPIQELHECLVLKGFAVINVSRGNHEVKQLALLIADQVQLESEEPAHGALAPLRNTLECLVYMDALVLAYPQRCAVNEADACTLTQQHLLDEQEPTEKVTLFEAGLHILTLRSGRDT